METRYGAADRRGRLRRATAECHANPCRHREARATDDEAATIHASGEGGRHAAKMTPGHAKGMGIAMGNFLSASCRLRCAGGE